MANNELTPEQDFIKTKIEEEWEKNNFLVLYGFNRTGKTSIAQEFIKNQEEQSEEEQSEEDQKTKKEEQEYETVVYNAHFEDLFTWDNGGKEEEEKKNPVLNIADHKIYSKYHSNINEDHIRENLIKFGFKFDLRFEATKDDRYKQSVSFFYKDKDKDKDEDEDEDKDKDKDKDEVSVKISRAEENIYKDKDKDKDEVSVKISRAEENIFILCFFLAILKSLDDDKDYKIIIDDPISSLDDNNLMLSCELIIEHLADKAYNQDGENEKGQKLFNGKKNNKILLLTHHFAFYNRFSDRHIKRFISFDNVAKPNSFFVKKEAEDKKHKYTLEEKCENYHKHLLTSLQGAYDGGELTKLHFNITRQVLEGFADSLHYKDWKNFAEGFLKLKPRHTQLINKESHLDKHGITSTPNKLVQDNIDIINEVLSKINSNLYGGKMKDILNNNG